MKKHILSLLLTLSLCFSLFPVTAQAAKGTFTDVPPDHWAFDSIEALAGRKAINGYPDGNFYPERTVSREEFAKIMVVAAGLTPIPAATSTYADVPLTYWASPYIETARPYMTAYQNQGQLYFYPTTGALREDIAVAVIKLRALDPAQADLGLLDTMFTDVSSISPVARPYVALAVEQGIITGYKDGTFRGQGTITRSEAAAILWRAFQQGSGDKVIPDDILPTPTPEPTPTPTPEPVPTPSPEPGLRNVGWALVTASSRTQNDRVRLLFSDGTTNVCDVDSSWEAWDAGALVLCGYRKTDRVYVQLDAGTSITAGYNKDAGTFGGMEVMEEAVCFVETAPEKYQVLLFRDFPSFSPQWALYAADDQDRVTAIYTVDPRTPLLSDTQYGYITLDSLLSSIDGELCTEFTLWDGEEEFSVIERGRHSYAAGTPISFQYTYGMNGEVDNVQELTGTVAAITAYDGNDLICTTETEYYFPLSKDTKIIFVDTDRKEGVESGSLCLADFAVNEDGQELEQWIPNILFQTGEDGKTLIVIFADVNNRW